MQYSDYLDKTKRYINKFSEKDICVLEEIVDKFNDNKFFNDLEDFKYKEPTDFAVVEEISEFFDLLYEEREDFTSKYEWKAE